MNQVTLPLNNQIVYNELESMFWGLNSFHRNQLIFNSDENYNTKDIKNNPKNLEFLKNALEYLQGE